MNKHHVLYEQSGREIPRPGVSEMYSETYMYPERGDEIDLVDLWIVLARGKYIILYCLIGSIVAGLFYVFLAPDKYKYQISIEVGSTYGNDGKLVPLESLESVQTKLKDSYIPQVIRQYVDAHEDERGFSGIDVFSSKNSGVITFGGVAPVKYEDKYLGAVNAVAEMLINDHQRMMSVEKKELELKKQQVSNQIDSLVDEEKLLQSRLERMADKKALVEERIKYLQGIIADARKNRQSAVNNSNDAGKALALMMMDNELRAARNKLSDLKTQLTVDMKNEHDMLVNQLHQNKRKQMEKHSELLKYDVELANLLETRALGEPIKSVKRAGPSKKLIMILLAFLGLAVGVFVVFFREFVGKVKERQQQSDALQDTVRS